MKPVPDIHPDEGRPKAYLKIVFSRWWYTLQGVLVSVALIVAIHFVAMTARERLEQDLHVQVSMSALEHVVRIEGELNGNVFLANGMIALVKAVDNPNAEEFNEALRALYDYGRHVRNVGVAPDNRLSFVYPLEGNEGAIGLYYPDEPEQWRAVKRAIDMKQTVLAGPVELKQGGMGLISRTPVFLNDGAYWGILSLVLDGDSLLSVVGLKPERNGVLYGLRGVDGLGEAGAVFLGDEGVFEEEVIRVSVQVPGGKWILAAIPKGGWSAGQGGILVTELMAIFFALVLGGAVVSIQRSRMVIQSSEQRLRAFVETTRDGVVVIDNRGMIHEFNRAAELLFGLEAKEAIGQRVNMLMPEAESMRHDGYIAQATTLESRTMVGSREVMGKRKNGEPFPVEITVGGCMIGDTLMHVGVIRDITERKAFESKLVEMATIDGLTGALTRRAIIEEGENALRLAKRHDRELSLLMIDADHFKNVNDTYGHQIGDAVLVLLCTLIRKCLRTTDILGRYGGEEFAVLLPETDKERAVTVAERILETVRTAKLELGDDQTLSFTVSIGLAEKVEQTEILDGLIKVADDALYRAKESGRDRWCD